jgi:hypothetical protein
MLAAASSINHNLVKRQNGCAQTGSIRKADINVIRRAGVAKRGFAATASHSVSNVVAVSRPTFEHALTGCLDCFGRARSLESFRVTPIICEVEDGMAKQSEA